MAEQQQQRRPNILWIFGDQHRGQALGMAGDPNLHTPNVDRLAADGSWTQRAVGGCPLCGPYRGALLSGRYPHLAVPGHEHPLDPAQPTVAQPFNDAGYHTAYFGKWHVDGFHERDGRAAMHIIPPERRGGSDNGSDTKTTTPSGTAGCTATMSRAARSNCSACPATRPMS